MELNGNNLGWPQHNQTASPYPTAAVPQHSTAQQHIPCKFLITLFARCFAADDNHLSLNRQRPIVSQLLFCSVQCYWRSLGRITNKASLCSAWSSAEIYLSLLHFVTETIQCSLKKLVSQKSHLLLTRHRSFGKGRCLTRTTSLKVFDKLVSIQSLCALYEFLTGSTLPIK